MARWHRLGCQERSENLLRGKTFHMNRVFTGPLGFEREKWQKFRQRIGECTVLADWSISTQASQNGAGNTKGAKRNKIVQAHECVSVRYTVASCSPPIRKKNSQGNRNGNACF
jgi:hypothetical protein